MKNFIEYKCDTCKRTIILENDTKRFFIPKCNITLGCTGVLQKIKEQNARGSTTVSSVAGVNDWRPKDYNVNFAPELQDEKFICLSSGTQNEITLASIDNVPSISLVFNVVKSVAVAYKEYTYNRYPPVNQILGIDDTPEKKLLKFNNTDNLKVFLNGVEVVEGLVWNKNVSTQSITFLSPILDESTVVIIVYPQQTTTQKIITFNRNVNGGNTGSCWGNVNNIKYGNDVLYVYTYDSAELDIDVNSSISLTNIINSTINNSILLLSNNPWNITDRIFTFYGDCNKITNNVANIRMIKKNERLSIEISEFGISDAFPPFQLNSIFSQEEFNTKNIKGTDFLEIHAHKNILGPV